MNRKTLLLAFMALSLGTAALAQDKSLDFSEAATAGKKLAFVVGCKSYKGQNALSNPINDAKAMRSVLTELGFEVIYREDASLAAINSGLTEFGKKATRAKVRLFYFSGHGAQVNGKNYLLPIDFVGGDLDIGTLDMESVLNRMQTPEKVINLLILDACRNNPFLESKGNGGLALVSAASGTLIAYATAPGKTASDNSSEGNGLYTRALLDALRKPGLSVNDVMDATGFEVENASKGRQVPWINSSLRGKFVFRNDAAAVGKTSGVNVATKENKESNNKESSKEKVQKVEKEEKNDSSPAPTLDGTAVKLKLRETLKSGDSKVDQEVTFEVISDIFSEEKTLVIPAGSIAYGKVTQSKKARSFGQSGKLEFTCEYILMKDGRKLPLRSEKISKRGGDNRTGAAIATALFLPAGFLMNGKNITIEKGKEVTVYVDTNRK